MSPSPPLPRVGVVVLNWHGRPQTLRCIEALRCLGYESWFLVLIDNGCREFSADEVERLATGGCYLHSAENLGFTGGANLGMREALARGADLVWFLNNDTRPEPEALSELVAVARADPSPAVVGAKILQAHDPTRLDSVALHVDLGWGRVRLLGHDEVDRGQYDDLTRVVAVTGCAMLVGRAACESLGGFDERFFAYLEDADLCLRARDAGLAVAAAPRARVLHERPPAGRGRQSVSSLYYASRNHLLLVDRHGGGPAWRRALRRCVVLALNLAYAARAGRGARAAALGAVLRGARDRRRAIVGEAR